MIHFMARKVKLRPSGAVPRYFLHLLNDASCTWDEEGCDFPSVKAACEHARRTLGAVIADELPGARNVFHLTVMIDDEKKVRVATIKAVTNVVASISPFAD
jgi:hypothetical protein